MQHVESDGERFAKRAKTRSAITQEGWLMYGANSTYLCHTEKLRMLVDAAFSMIRTTRRGRKES